MDTTQSNFLIDVFNTTMDVGEAVFNISNNTLTTTESTTPNDTFKAPIEPSWVYWLPGPFICAFGIVCNTLNLAVLCQRMLKDSPYTYLTALAISDLTLLFTSFIHLVKSKDQFTFLKSFYDIYIFFSFGNIFFNASVWFVVLMTIERVFFVTRPLTFHSSRRNARLLCCLIFILCTIINIPRFFCYEIIKLNGTFYPKGTAFKNSQMYYKISWAHALLITFIPISILTVANIILIYSIRKAGKERVALHSNKEFEMRQEQTRLTRTLVAVVVVFIICVFPSAFVEDPIAYSLFGGDRTWSDFIRSPANQLFIYISNLLLFLNSSLNFVLYCAFNRKFRQATKTLLNKVCPYFRSCKAGVINKLTSNSTAYTIESSRTMDTHL